MANWRYRLKGAGLHLVCSLAVALVAGALVFGLWYPFPYSELSGGRELFFLVVTVDVILGPLITFAVLSASKTKRQLAADLCVVVLLQLLGLAYGLWTVSVARPVLMVFEIDRLRVVHRVEIDDELLSRAPPDLARLPWGSPGLMAVREFKNRSEKGDATLLAVQGLQLSAQPSLWEPYAAATARVVAAARPLQSLQARHPGHAPALRQAAAAAGLEPGRALYLPVVGRKLFWTALIDPDSGYPRAYVALDPY